MRHTHSMALSLDYGVIQVKTHHRQLIPLAACHIVDSYKANRPAVAQIDVFARNAFRQATVRSARQGVSVIGDG